ncbi:hypothetical protein ACIQWR_12615 [Streptomyces sp. NPDC098789]|uniref:hypothetical protein n=1 Tax=Streptomyces sp. NPDC098789 TaxID=3366098 RepID=UPI00382DAEF4
MPALPAPGTGRRGHAHGPADSPADSPARSRSRVLRTAAAATVVTTALIGS